MSRFTDASNTAYICAFSLVVFASTSGLESNELQDGYQRILRILKGVVPNTVLMNLKIAVNRPTSGDNSCIKKFSDIMGILSLLLAIDERGKLIEYVSAFPKLLLLDDQSLAILVKKINGTL